METDFLGLVLVFKDLLRFMRCRRVLFFSLLLGHRSFLNVVLFCIEMGAEAPVVFALCASLTTPN